MCGSLRFNDKDTKIGHPCPITLSDGKQVEATWNGFARSEVIDGWIKNNWASADVKCSGYNESGRDYSLPAGHCIKAVVKQVGPEKYVFNIQTRESIGAERDIHDRWVVVVHRRY
jgi:hypothetical protein